MTAIAWGGDSGGGFVIVPDFDPDTTGMDFPSGGATVPTAAIRGGTVTHAIVAAMRGREPMTRTEVALATGYGANVCGKYLRAGEAAGWATRERRQRLRGKVQGDLWWLT